VPAALPARPPTPAPSGTGGPTPGLPGWLDAYNRWVQSLPAHAVWLWHHAAALWWPWTPLAVLLLAAGTIAARTAQAAVWRRVAAGGYWVAITPPRAVEAADWDAVWRRLRLLAQRARGGRWRLIRPPLAFEIHTADGRLTAGLWLPAWVPYPDAADEITRAWPGATVQLAQPPTLNTDGTDGTDRDRAAVVGYRLAASTWHPDTGWLVAQTNPPTVPRIGTDPYLGRLLAALGEPGGPALLQVLVRPATRRRLAHLRKATDRPVQPARSFARWVLEAGLGLLSRVPRLLFAVWDFWTTTGTRASRTRNPDPPDRVETVGMREATAKLHRPPHLLVSIRIGAVRKRRRDAREAAQAIAAGYGDASAWLHTVRLPGAAGLLARRRARDGHWLLLTATELGVLAHLPPDPGRYRFDTTALHRPLPRDVRQADPEQRTDRDPGWTRRGWTPAPDTADDSGQDTDPNNNTDTDDGEYDDGTDDSPEAA
jgi:hypothetical protein